MQFMFRYETRHHRQKYRPIQRPHDSFQKCEQDHDGRRRFPHEGCHRKSGAKETCGCLQDREPCFPVHAVRYHPREQGQQQYGTEVCKLQNLDVKTLVRIAHSLACDSPTLRRIFRPVACI